MISLSKIIKDINRARRFNAEDLIGGIRNKKGY